MSGDEKERKEKKNNYKKEKDSKKRSLRIATCSSNRMRDGAVLHFYQQLINRLSTTKCG